MSIPLNEVRNKINANKALLIDCREEEEWELSHLSEAHHLPLSELKEGKVRETFPEEKMLYIHCRSGVRCQKAAEILKKMYKNVEALDCNYDDLVDADFPTE